MSRGRATGAEQLDRPRLQRDHRASRDRSPVVPERRPRADRAGRLASVGRRERLELLGFVAALLAGLVVFHALGGGALAPPPLDPAGWAGWAAARDPVLAAVALLRLVVLALLWYLVGATAVGVLARLARSVRLVRVADALTIPAVRRVVRSGLGVTLAVGMVANAVTQPPRTHPMPPVHLAAAEDPVPRGVDRQHGPVDADVTDHDTEGDDPEGDTAADTVVDDTAVGPEVDRPLPLQLLDAATQGADPVLSPGARPPRSTRTDRPPVPAGDRPGPGRADAGLGQGELRHGAGPTPLELARGAVPAAAAPSDDAAAVPAAGDPSPIRPTPPSEPTPGRAYAGEERSAPSGSGNEVIVAPGDSFWSIAAAAVGAATPGAPTEARIASYWRSLVAANHDRLVVPGEPDLLHPGQRLRLPAIGGDPRG
jgi:hypothetical protein